MDVKLLGPVSAQLHGQSVLPRAAKPRRVFALLALHAGRIVRVSTLIDELWGANPPDGCMTTLQTYIHQLRCRLQAALTGGPPAPSAAIFRQRAKDIITTQYDGYMLAMEPAGTDVSAFRDLVRTGYAAFDAGDDHAASTHLDRALNLWHGQALADLPVGRVLEPEVISLEDARLGALDRRIEADLRLGRHAELLGELGLLMAQNPVHEGFCAYFMTALYRSGNTPRALEVFRRLRNVLVDESGVEPSPRLRQIQGAILMGDPALQWADAGRVAMR